MKISASLYLLPFLQIVSCHSKQRTSIRSVAVIDDATFYSRDVKLKYDSKLELAFSTSKSGPVQLELEPNFDLLHHGSAQFVLNNGAGDESTRILVDGTAFKVYKGRAMKDTGSETSRVGTARILVHQQKPLSFEGHFSIGQDIFHVQLSQDYERLKGPLDAPLMTTEVDKMVLWSDADASHVLEKRSGGTAMREEITTSSCSTDTLYSNRLKIDSILHPFTTEPTYGRLKAKRQLAGDTGDSYTTQAQLAATIGQTAGCPKQREVAVLGAALDCNFVQQFNSTASARASIIAAFNSASSVYEESFNISLGLGQIVISEATCPTSAAAASPWNTACDGTTTIGDRLSEFSQWRGQQADSFAAWSLLTTCNTGSEIGVAWLGTLCNANSTNQTSATVSGTNVIAASSSAGSYWRTIAHELGHNYGANHDCDSSTCGTSTACCPLSASVCPTAGNYLMNAAASTSASTFSPCTIGQVCTNIGQKLITTTCLTTNENVKLEGAASCGNGIVEEGEDCDCGGTAGCGDNKCCDATTCKFTTGSVCDSEISACCTGDCQFASAETVCRASTGFCDPVETCTGDSGSCPPDAFAKNGESCGTSLQCASGQCTSRDLQCTTQMNGSQAACDDTSCALTCLLGNQCYISNSYFITGTPCGYGGVCQTGNCEEGSLGHQLDSWFDSNKKWLIPVIAVVGGLIVVLALYFWTTSLIQAVRKRQRRKKQVPEMTYTNQSYASYDPSQNQVYDPPSYPSQAYYRA